MDLFRTWLFVPGHKEKMVQKSLGLDTDVIMLDIEDGVPHAEKNLARKFITSVRIRRKFYWTITIRPN